MVWNGDDHSHDRERGPRTAWLGLWAQSPTNGLVVLCTINIRTHSGVLFVVHSSVSWSLGLSGGGGNVVRGEVVI